MSLRLVLVWLCFTVLVAQGAVVPDGSVVQHDEGAPKIPAPTQAVRKPVKPHRPAGSSTRPTPNPANRPNPTSPASGTAPGSGPASGSSAFEEQSGPGLNEGEAKPLTPLAPAPLSGSSTAPLWATLFLFLFLAAGGFWLAQQRNQD